jgi:hypothetical protein
LRDTLARIFRELLASGSSIDIDGLGSLRFDANGKPQWRPDQRKRVFVAYVAEDADHAARLVDAMEAAGIDAWLDTRKLFPGQDWQRAIEREIHTSDYFVAVVSRRSMTKRGGFQRELRQALDAAQAVPLGKPFIIPFRLDDTIPPAELSEAQWVDAFPDFDKATRRVIRRIQAA